MKRTTILSAMLLVAIAPISATADMTEYTVDGVSIGFGNVGVGNSWYFDASASGVGPYDLVAVRIASGSDVFESPAITNISDPDWHMVLNTPTLASFGGDPVSSLSWRTNFAGGLPMGSPLELDWAIFYDQQLTAWTHWHVNINGGLDKWWLNPVGGWQPSYAQVVPIPAAVLIGMLGLGVAGLKLRKFV